MSEGGVGGRLREWFTRISWPTFFVVALVVFWTSYCAYRTFYCDELKLHEFGDAVAGGAVILAMAALLIQRKELAATQKEFETLAIEARDQTSIFRTQLEASQAEAERAEEIRVKRELLDVFAVAREKLDRLLNEYKASYAVAKLHERSAERKVVIDSVHVSHALREASFNVSEFRPSTHRVVEASNFYRMLANAARAAVASVESDFEFNSRVVMEGRRGGLLELKRELGRRLRECAQEAERAIN